MINAFGTKNDYLDFSFLNDVLENTLERYKVSPQKGPLKIISINHFLEVFHSKPNGIKKFQDTVKRCDFEQNGFVTQHQLNQILNKMFPNNLSENGF